jgi:hypothetical protein
MKNQKNRTKVKASMLDKFEGFSAPMYSKIIGGKDVEPNQTGKVVQSTTMTRDYHTGVAVESSDLVTSVLNDSPGGGQF